MEKDKVSIKKKNSASKNIARSEPLDNRSEMALNYKFDEYGLRNNVKYLFKDNGRVDWRSMVNPDYLYPNSDFFQSIGREIPESIEGLKDHELLIKLGGINELADLRGILHQETFFDETSPDRVVARCKITFVPNYETGMIEQTWCRSATATKENVKSGGRIDMHKFLEATAENRAFVRCVRTFLKIDIVGFDEIGPSKPNNGGMPEQPAKVHVTGPIEKIKELLSLGDDEFGSFKSEVGFLYQKELYNNEKCGEWKSWDDIPKIEATKILNILKENR